MNFNGVARVYWWLEWLAFGGRLQRVRVAHLEFVLSGVPEGGKVLVAGDGDGRFLCALLEKRQDLAVDYVERSSVMLELARKRVEKKLVGVQVGWRHCDVREWEGEGYDLVVSHFLLDCFGEAELEEVVSGLAGKIRPGGRWVISDFSEEPGWWARWWVRVMYFFFGIFAGLKNRALVPPQDFVKGNGMERVRRYEVMRGFIYSEVWEKLEGRAGKIAEGL